MCGRPHRAKGTSSRDCVWTQQRQTVAPKWCFLKKSSKRTENNPKTTRTRAENKLKTTPEQAEDNPKTMPRPVPRRSKVVPKLPKGGCVQCGKALREDPGRLLQPSWCPGVVPGRARLAVGRPGARKRAPKMIPRGSTWSSFSHNFATCLELCRCL